MIHGTYKCPVCGSDEPHSTHKGKHAVPTSVEAYGCWSNERCIAEEGMAGVMYGMLFATPEQAAHHYAHHIALLNAVLVKVTVSTVPPNASLSGLPLGKD